MRTKTVVGGSLFVLAGAVVLASLLLYSPEAPAAPSVTWTPSAVVQDVAAGETVTTTASFTASTTLRDVVVRVVPELAPYVVVDPAAFASVAKGGTYNITLSMSAPVDAEIGTYDGTIQLRSGKKPNKTYAKPLPVALDVVWPTFDGSEQFGFTIDYPAGWYVDTTPGLTVFSNVDDPYSVNDEARGDIAFFRVLIRYNDNPQSASVEQWFTESLRPLIEDRIEDVAPLTVNGNAALHATLTGIGEERTNIYLTRGIDVIEITFGNYAPQFMDEYASMLDSFQLTP